MWAVVQQEPNKRCPLKYKIDGCLTLKNVKISDRPIQHNCIFAFKQSLSFHNLSTALLRGNVNLITSLTDSFTYCSWLQEASDLPCEAGSLAEQNLTESRGAHPGGQSEHNAE